MIFLMIFRLIKRNSASTGASRCLLAVLDCFGELNSHYNRGRFVYLIHFNNLLYLHWCFCWTRKNHASSTLVFEWATYISTFFFSSLSWSRSSCSNSIDVRTPSEKARLIFPLDASNRCISHIQGDWFTEQRSRAINLSNLPYIRNTWLSHHGLLWLLPPR